MENRADLRIMGSGSASGGLYQNVIISGSGRISGSIDCNSLRINGSLKLEGSVKADSFTVNGSARIHGDAETKDFRINGSTDVDGEIKSENLRIQGSANSIKTIYAGYLELKGGLRTDGNCTADYFEGNGGVTIGGLLNAGTLKLEMFFPGSAGEIGGEKIIITRSRFHVFWWRSLINSLFFPNSGTEAGMTAETIEGDDIYLEYTTAKVVRGNNVRIGLGCSIDLVEYSQNFTQHSDSRVGEINRTGRI